MRWAKARIYQGSTHQRRADRHDVDSVVVYKVVHYVIVGDLVIIGQRSLSEYKNVGSDIDSVFTIVLRRRRREREWP